VRDLTSGVTFTLAAPFLFGTSVRIAYT
jgi:hypothetical protein